MPRHVDPGRQIHRQSENCYAGQWTMDNAVLLVLKNISVFSNKNSIRPSVVPPPPLQTLLCWGSRIRVAGEEAEM
jgi:hypothetical protein